MSNVLRSKEKEENRVRKGSRKVMKKTMGEEGVLEKERQREYLNHRSIIPGMRTIYDTIIRNLYFYTTTIFPLVRLRSDRGPGV